MSELNIRTECDMVTYDLRYYPLGAERFGDFESVSRGANSQFFKDQIGKKYESMKGQYSFLLCMRNFVLFFKEGLAYIFAEVVF